MVDETKIINIIHLSPRNFLSYDEYIGRGSDFGNPFVIGKHGTRKEVIDKYKIYFEALIDNKPEFKKKILSLRGKVLGCYCAPLPCHGDIIIEWLKNNDTLLYM